MKERGGLAAQVIFALLGLVLFASGLAHAFFSRTVTGWYVRLAQRGWFVADPGNETFTRTLGWIQISAARAS
jgi:hypothetical protein